MDSLYIAHATLYPGDGTLLADQGILIENEQIKQIGPTQAHPQATRRIDARGAVVMPGFINTHMHFYSTFARGLGKAQPASDFMGVLNNLWWRLDKALTWEDCKLSAWVPLLEAIRSGTTTLIDHHASPMAATGSLDAVAEAVLGSGLRASLCYEVSDRDGSAIAQAGIEENVRFAKRLAREPHPRLRAMMGLHASFTLSDNTLQHAATAAHNLNIGCHIHAAEDVADQTQTLGKHGKRVGERLFDMKILGSKSICAHGVHLQPGELDLLASTNTALVYNPQSNMNNAVGGAPILSALQRGVMVGLGTDAMTVNMREEVRTALWLQKHAAQNPSVGFVEILNTLLSNNAKIAARQWIGLGILSPGSLADIVILDYIPPTPITAQNFLGHFAFGLCGAPVRTTIASGRVLMHNFALEIDVDEECLMAQSREAAEKVWARF